MVFHAEEMFLSVYFLSQMRFYEDKHGLKFSVANERIQNKMEQSMKMCRTCCTTAEKGEFV